MIQTRGHLYPLLLLLVTGVMLGATTNLAKYASNMGLPPLAFLAWSIFSAAILLSGVCFWRSRLPAIKPITVEYFLVAAMLTVAGPNLIFFSAIPRIGAGFVAFLIAFPPLLTYLGALALGMERFDPLRAAGVSAALLGAVILTSGKLSSPDAPTLWIALALCGPVLLAMGDIYRSLRWPEGESGDVLAPWMLIAAAAMLFLAGLFPAFSIAIPSGDVLALVLIATQTLLFAGQFLLLFELQKHGGPVLLSLLGAVGALVGVPLAILVFGEAPPGELMVASPLIALGIGLVSWGGMRNSSSE